MQLVHLAERNEQQLYFIHINRVWSGDRVTNFALLQSWRSAAPRLNSYDTFMIQKAMHRANCAINSCRIKPITPEYDISAHALVRMVLYAHIIAWKDSFLSLGIYACSRRRGHFEKCGTKSWTYLPTSHPRSSDRHSGHWKVESSRPL